MGEQMTGGEVGVVDWASWGPGEVDAFFFSYTVEDVLTRHRRLETLSGSSQRGPRVQLEERTS